jgi:HNH endonuclease
VIKVFEAFRFTLAFSREVRRERGNKCEVCKVSEDLSTPQTKLHCHHIKKQRLYSALERVKSNIIVLCQPCHVVLENADKEVFEMLTV